MSNSETSVSRTVTVNAPREYVFDVFTKHFDSWWPRTHKIGKAALANAVLEPREGGRWYERGVDGSECEWGRVLAYVPPSRVAVSWHLNAQFQYDPDPTKASRVEVSFHAESNTRTRVELVHSGLDRHGAGWEKVRDSIGSPGGWGDILGNFAKTAELAAAHS